MRNGRESLRKQGEARESLPKNEPILKTCDEVWSSMLVGCTVSVLDYNFRAEMLYN